MRKILFALVMLLCMLPAAALAASYTYPEQGATFSIPSDKYTVITSENVAEMTEWLTKHSTTAEAVQADFKDRGVLLQAWGTAGDVCLEITAVQDQYGMQYFDVNQVTENERKDYRLGHSSDKTGEWRALGYDYTSAQWKNYASAGRFLQLEYTRTVNGQTYRGHARKTVRNGWHFNVEYQVFDRAVKTSDKTALETVMNTWEFVNVGARPVTSATKVIFTSTPPAETNTGKFTLEGTGSSGLKVLCVAMRMSTREAYQFEATANNKGKFSLDIKLPREGYWLLTYTVYNGETVLEEGAFDAITYDDTLLPVSLNTTLPKTMALTGNKLTISGTTMKQTKVQCIVDGRYEKAVTTNNTGKFTFTIDTSEEGIYNITLAFEKKGYDARRIRCEATREFTAEDLRQVIRDEAVKPVYKTLVSKIDGYRGRYMVYTLYIREVLPTTTGYLTFAGMTKTKSGTYQQIVAIRTTEEPSWSAGGSAHMYLKCLGMYDVIGDEGTDSYPYFDLQWVE